MFGLKPVLQRNISMLKSNLTLKWIVMQSSKSLKKEQKLLWQYLFKRYTLVTYLLLNGAHWYISVLKWYIFIPFEKVTLWKGDSIFFSFLRMYIKYTVNTPYVFRSINFGQQWWCLHRCQISHYGICKKHESPLCAFLDKHTGQISSLLILLIWY